MATIAAITQTLIDFGIRNSDFKLKLVGTLEAGILVPENPEYAKVITVFVENGRSPGARGAPSLDPTVANRIRINANLDGLDTPQTVNRNSYFMVESDGYWSKDGYKNRFREILKECQTYVTRMTQLVFDQNIEKSALDSVRKKRAEEAPVRLEIFNSLKAVLKDKQEVKVVSEQPGFNIGLQLENGVKLTVGIDGNGADISYVDFPIGFNKDDDKFTKLIEGLSKL